FKFIRVDSVGSMPSATQNRLSRAARSVRLASTRKTGTEPIESSPSLSITLQS
ncbi:3208_t:CDS:1, partial [Funneliformis mosseae]